MVRLEEVAGKDPPSNETVQKMFLWFIETLDHKIKKIHRVRHLFYPGTLKGFMQFGYSKEQYKNELCGLQNRGRIYISITCSKRTAIRCLLHELSHFLFDLDDNAVEEKAALIIEKRFSKRFTREQKEKLWSYIPKKVTLENIDNEPN